MNTEISSKVIKTELVKWSELEFFQNKNLKEISSEAESKLKASLLSNQFAQPFYVWQDSEKIRCLDGMHRVRVLHQLLKEGKQIPEMLPATFIDCKDEKEAAKMVLMFSAYYARITSEGIFDFIENFGINFDLLKSEIELPSLDLNILNDRFMAEPQGDELVGLSKDKPISIKITVKDANHVDLLIPEIELIIGKYEGAYFTVSAGEL